MVEIQDWFASIYPSVPSSNFAMGNNLFHPQYVCLLKKYCFGKLKLSWVGGGDGGGGVAFEFDSNGKHYA